MKSKIHERPEKSIMGVSKKTNTFRLAGLLMLLSGLFLTRTTMAQDETQERIINDSKSAKASFLKTDPSMENLFNHSAGYVIFPNVGKK